MWVVLGRKGCKAARSLTAALRSEGECGLGLARLSGQLHQNRPSAAQFHALRPVAWLFHRADSSKRVGRYPMTRPQGPEALVGSRALHTWRGVACSGAFPIQPGTSPLPFNWSSMDVFMAGYPPIHWSSGI